MQEVIQSYPNMLSSWKSAAICLALGYLVLRTGPDYVARQMLAFYQKPHATLYPVPCMLSQCSAPLATCLLDPNCRKTTGNQQVLFQIFAMIPSYINFMTLI